MGQPLCLSLFLHLTERAVLATISRQSLFGIVWSVVYNALPLEIEPFKLAHKGAKFVGSIELNQFPRLREVVGSRVGVAEVKLNIGREESGFVFITGSVITLLELICQRCGGPLLYDMNVDLKLSPVLMDSQVVNIPKGYEPWVTHNEPVSVVELVEEELLLGLPMIAKHNPEKCSVDVSHVSM